MTRKGDIGNESSYFNCTPETRLGKKFLSDPYSSRKRLRTKVTPDLHLTYSKNGGNLGLVLNDKK